MSTSDSVDRVFSHALATVRRLPRTGSSRPPPSARLRLYGLYKQSMEGDVEAILPRPVLPLPPSPPPFDASPSIQSLNSALEDSTSTAPDDTRPSLQQRSSSMTAQNTVHRYASRDLRTREAQAEIEKWDAWHACAGMSRTEAKRKYIEALIATMKEYASGTLESRELVGELEFVWGQIRNQSDGSGSGRGADNNSRSGSGGSGPEKRKSSSEEDEEGESPRRSGLKGLSGFGSASEARSKSKKSGSSNSRTRLRTRKEEIASDGTRLRVLSPMSPRNGSDVVEGRDADSLPADSDNEDAEPTQFPASRSSSSRLAALESQLRHLSTEIAALREQLSANNLLSSSTYSASPQYQRLRLHWKMFYRAISWLKYLAVFAVRQVLVGVAILGVLVLRERWLARKRGGMGKGERGKVEDWVRERWREWRGTLGAWRGWDGMLWWLGGFVRVVRGRIGGA